MRKKGQEYDLWVGNADRGNPLGPSGKGKQVAVQWLTETRTPVEKHAQLETGIPRHKEKCYLHGGFGVQVVQKMKRTVLGGARDHAAGGCRGEVKQESRIHRRG